MKSLQEILLVKIAFNLDWLDKQRNKSEYFPIPSILANRIFDYRINYRKPLTENEVKYLTIDYLKLTYVKIHQKHLKDGVNFEFLSTQNIQILDLCKCKINGNFLCQSIIDLRLETCHFDELAFELFKNSIENCLNLKVFKIINCNFTNFGEISKILRLLSSNITELEILETLTSIEISDLSYVLREFKNLEKITLRSDCSSDNIFFNLCKNLSVSASGLTKISFQNCCLSKDECILLGQFLKNCNSLLEIDLSSNKNMDVGFQDVCKGLIASSHLLSNITLNDCNLSDFQCKYLRNLLRQCKNVKVLNFFGNKFFDNGYNDIMEGLKIVYKTLIHLDLRRCEKTDKKCFYIGVLLKNCFNLQVFLLDDCLNNFEKVLNGLRSSCSTLKTIYLRSVVFNSEAISEFSNLINCCSNSLKEIELNHCSFINITCTVSLFNIPLKKQLKITKFKLINSNLIEKDFYELGIFLSKCNSLEIFDLTGNIECKSIFENICTSLRRSSSTLKEINFNGCNLSKNQFITLGYFLRECKYLENINIGFNDELMQKECFEFMCKCIKKSGKYLKFLNLAECRLNKNHCNTLIRLLKALNCLELIIFDLFIEDMDSFDDEILQVCQDLSIKYELSILSFNI